MLAKEQENGTVNKEKKCLTREQLFTSGIINTRALASWR